MRLSIIKPLKPIKPITRSALRELHRQTLNRVSRLRANSKTDGAA